MAIYFINLKELLDYSDHFKKIIKRCKRVGYDIDVMRQSACLIVNPTTVDSYGFLFNCTTSDLRLNDGPNVKL